METGHPSRARAGRQRTLLVAALALLVAAVCIALLADHLLWIYALACALGMGAIALGIVSALGSRKGRRWLPIVIAVLGGVAALGAAAGLVRASLDVATGAVVPSTPGVSKPFVVATSKAAMLWPEVSGDVVVWMDQRNSPAARPFEDWDIYGYDLKAKRELRICTAPGRQLFPAISGRTVVWMDERRVTTRQLATRNHRIDIYGYDLATRHEFPICTAKGGRTDVAISGKTVVWSDARRGPGLSDIYGYDLTTKRAFPICTAPGMQRRPAVSGNVVVWLDYRRATKAEAGAYPQPCDVYGCDLTTKREFRIGSSAGAWRALVDGRTVVWSDAPEDRGHVSFTVADLTTGGQRTVAIKGSSLQGPTGLSGGIVALTRDDASPLGFGEQVWLYDLVRGKAFAISAGGGNSSPGISGGLVVWSGTADEGMKSAIEAVRLSR
jgi:beta propeller repeat protein